MTKFKRKTKTKADAILCADLHIRSDTPVCRTDNFFEAMERKIDFILDLQVENDCPILVAGDLGYKSQWSNWLLEWTISKFKEHKIICIPGQHDLPNHRLDLWEKSGIGVLATAGAIELIGVIDPLQTGWEFDNFYLNAFPYSRGILHITLLRESICRIAITHQMIIESKPLWPGQDAPKGHQILKKFLEYQLVLSGDNHNAFVAEYQGRKLVNPGSMMRTSADQEKHKPRVYLWYAETNDIKPVYLPIEQGVISRTHIDVAQDRRNRNNAFIKRIASDTKIQLSYEDNLENYFNKYRTEKRVREKTWEAVK